MLNAVGSLLLCLQRKLSQLKSVALAFVLGSDFEPKQASLQKTRLVDAVAKFNQAYTKVDLTLWKGESCSRARLCQLKVLFSARVGQRGSLLTALTRFNAGPSRSDAVTRVTRRVYGEHCARSPHVPVAVP